MSAEDDRKLFVAGLPESITETVLRQIFEAAGATVVDVSLPKDRATGRPRGFGFVTLGTAEQALSIRSALDGSIQSGRSISVRPFNSEPPKRGEGRPEGGGPAGGPGGGEDRTLYVGNLPYETTPQEVDAFFKEHSVEGVARVHLPSGPDGRLRGFGFVTMVSGEAANQAITGLRDADFRGRRLTVNIAHPKGAPGTRPPRSDGGPMGGGGGYDSIPSPAGFGGDSSRPLRPARLPDRAEATKKRKKGQRRWEHIDGKKGRQGGGAKGWDDED